MRRAGCGCWLTVRMRFRPHPLVRFGILLPAGIIPMAIVSTWSSANSMADAREAGAVILVCALVAGRWVLFAGAECSDSHLIVRGLLWSRRIRRDAIMGFSRDYVFVRWRTRRDVVVFSPMGPFWSKPNPAAFVSAYNHTVLEKISDWVDSRPGHESLHSSAGRHAAPRV